MTLTRNCNFCDKPVKKNTGVHIDHKLIHKKCRIPKFLSERKSKCQECGEGNPPYLEVIQGLELGFCNSACAGQFKGKGTLDKIMSGEL